MEKWGGNEVSGGIRKIGYFLGLLPVSMVVLPVLPVSMVVLPVLPVSMVVLPVLPVSMVR